MAEWSKALDLSKANNAKMPMFCWCSPGGTPQQRMSLGVVIQDNEDGDAKLHCHLHYAHDNDGFFQAAP